MNGRKQTNAEIWQGLMAAKDIIETAKISRAHWHSLVKEGLAPAPALRIGTRYTRWLARDIQSWVHDPQGWINARPVQGDLFDDVPPKQTDLQLVS